MLSQASAHTVSGENYVQDNEEVIQTEAISNVVMYTTNFSYADGKYTSDFVSGDDTIWGIWYAQADIYFYSSSSTSFNIDIEVYGGIHQDFICAGDLDFDFPAFSVEEWTAAYGTVASGQEMGGQSVTVKYNVSAGNHHIAIRYVHGKGKANVFWGTFTLPFTVGQTLPHEAISDVVMYTTKFTLEDGAYKSDFVNDEDSVWAIWYAQADIYFTAMIPTSFDIDIDVYGGIGQDFICAGDVDFDFPDFLPDEWTSRYGTSASARETVGEEKTVSYDVTTGRHHITIRYVHGRGKANVFWGTFTLPFSVGKTIEMASVTFDANGGQFEDESLSKAVRVEIGQCLEEMPTPNNSGFGFDGWWHGNDELLSSTPITQSIIVKAKWILGGYSVEIKTDMGIASTSGEGTYAAGSSVTISVTVKPGYSFVGWSDGETALSRRIVVQATRNIYTAITKPNQYQVSFDANGGTLIGTNILNMQVQSDSFVNDAAGHYVVNPTPSPEINSYIATISFQTTSDLTLKMGWEVSGEVNLDYMRFSLLDSEEEDQIFPSGGGIGIIDSGVVFFHIPSAGQYSIEVELYHHPGAQTVFLYGGFTLPDTDVKTVTFNEPYGQLPQPQRNDYTFDGWYTQKTGGTHVLANTTYTTVGDQTLYAHWSPTPITVNVYLRVISKNGEEVTASNVGGKVEITQYVISGATSSSRSVTQTTANTSYVVHINKQFKMAATANEGFLFVGFSTSSTPSNSIKNPSSIVGTTATYYPSSNISYYVYFKQISPNQLKYDETDKYFYFEDGFYPQSKVDESTFETTPIANGETITYNDGANVVSIPVYTYKNDRYVKVTKGTEVGWFKFEPIRWRISDYGMAKSEKNIERYKTLLAFKGFASFSSNFVAVSDLVLGVGSMNATREADVGDDVTRFSGFANVQNIEDGCKLNFSYAQESKNIKVQNYATYAQGDVIHEGTTAYGFPLRIVSVEELDAVGLANKQARFSDMVAFILGLDEGEETTAYWTRDLSNLGAGVAISASGTQIRPWFDQLLGMRFAYTFSEGSSPI